MKSLACALLVVFGSAAAALAAENPTGTWKWTVTFNDRTRDQSVTLKLEGDKLTGTMPGRNDSKTEIQDGKFENDEVSFTVVRTRGDNKVTSKYKGKVTGDAIKGTIESDRGGQASTRDWEAKRAAE